MFIQRNNVSVLPIGVRIGERGLADHRDEEATLPAGACGRKRTPSADTET
ncbi:hypothetical protein FHT09_000376 [Xanthomonas arboricola]|nr:hypothetical protein [Xanthomonas sp. CFBP 8152]